MDVLTFVADSEWPITEQFVLAEPELDENWNYTGWIVGDKLVIDVVAGQELKIQVNALTDWSNWSTPAVDYTLNATFKSSKAVITAQPQSLEAADGETAVFTVAVDGDVASYQWYYRRNAADAWHTTKLSGFDTNKLSVAMNANRNGYQYYCVIIDTLGNKLTTEVATLTLEAAVTITVQPADQSVAAGANAMFAVTAEGEGLTYQWYYRRGAADSWHTTKLSGYNTMELTVPALATRDGYQYYCVVTDAQGSTVSSEIATLSVN